MSLFVRNRINKISFMKNLWEIPVCLFYQPKNYYYVFFIAIQKTGYETI